MRQFLLFSLLVLLSGCRTTPAVPADKTLPDWQNAALVRHLDGEVAAALKSAVQNLQQQSRRHGYPDLARFIRQAQMDKAGELSRELLWESTELCNAQFASDPKTFLREMRSGELRCQAALLIAEQQYLNQVIWKTPEQETRYRELQSELSSLFGSLPFGELDKIKLAEPGDLPDFSAAAETASEDPAESLQIAGVILQLPDEIRRQQFANPRFPVADILAEIQFLAAGYALHLDQINYRAALENYRKDPSALNLWHFRRWHYRTMLDLSRMPEKRGNQEARQFISSMILLQEGF